MLDVEGTGAANYTELWRVMLDYEEVSRRPFVAFAPQTTLIPLAVTSQKNYVQPRTHVLC